MRNILLLVHDDEGQEARLQAALDLTRALDGHLKCLDVTPLPVVVGDGYPGLGTPIIDEREQEQQNKARLTARLATEDVSWSWVDITGNFAECVIAEAGLADLIVLSRALDSFPIPDMRGIAGKVVMESRKPVVAVPETLRRFAFDRALIAWDGEASVTETMRAAVPLLKLAKEVELFMARESGERTDPLEAAEYLSRHGIHATIRIVQDGLHSADQLIAEEAGRWKADYVLMGAYSRGRIRETFGGVTKRLLGKATLPLILGH
jgi:nucleotide-binding universal stress UspA family protein